MTNGISALIGLTGTIVLAGVSLKTIEQIDIQGKRIIKPTKVDFPKLEL